MNVKGKLETDQFPVIVSAGSLISLDKQYYSLFKRSSPLDAHVLV